MEKIGKLIIRAQEVLGDLYEEIENEIDRLPKGDIDGMDDLRELLKQVGKAEFIIENL
jgi:hypothetical protein